MHFFLQKKRIIRYAVILIAGFICLKIFSFLFSFYSEIKNPFIMRIRVAHDLSEMKITSEKGCDVRGMVSKKLLVRNVRFKKEKIQSDETGIRIGQRMFEENRIRVIAARGHGIALNGVLYRGEVDVIKTDEGFNAVNRLDLEEYLKGVVPREVSHLWPFDAIKAQAIASRTFAVSQALLRRNKDYDVKFDTSSQVYGGRSSERLRTTRAVDKTRGEVLVFDGKVLPAYFHSCCGGHTEDAGKLWNEDIKSLKGVKCSWCRLSPYFKWKSQFSEKIICEKLNANGYDVERIYGIKPGKRDRSGRLEDIKIRSRKKWIDIPISKFRSVVGRNKLKSSNFNVKKRGKSYVFKGRGWGHGVGMCQWGAFGLALKWWKAERILKYYYSGAKVVKLDKGL